MFNWSDKFYRWVKWSVLLLIPTLGLAYQKLGAIWGFPYIEQIKATIDVIVYCLAVVLGINCAEYDSKTSALQKQLDTVEVEPAVKETKEDSSPTVEEPKEEEAVPTVEPTTEEAVPTVEEPVVVEEPIVEEPVAQKSEEERGIGGTCICEVNKSYNLTCNVKVRESYGTDARWLKRDELSEDGKAHSLDGEYAVLANGTEVFCQEVYKNWIKIPSGWICARDMDGTDNVTAEAKWQFPVNYVGIATGFSSSHLAYDFGFSSDPNQPIYAPCNCTVSACGWDGTVGNYVFANFEKGGQAYTWRFIHMAEYSVGVGQTLSQGQQVGLMGNTGSSSGGSHLHMDLWYGTYAGSMPSDRAGAAVDYLSMLYLYSHQSVGDVTDATYHINRA